MSSGRNNPNEGEAIETNVVDPEQPNAPSILDGANKEPAAPPAGEETVSPESSSNVSPPSSEQSWDFGLDEEPWEDVVTGYEREAKALGGDKSAAPLWYEAGLIHEDRLGRTRPAAVCFQTAFKLDPTWRPNIHVARHLFTDVGNWDMVAKLLQAEADATDDPLEKADLLFERAVLLHERLDRSSDAVALLAQVEELAPSRLMVLKYLEGLSARSRDYERLAKTCVREAEATDSSRLEVALLCIAGGLYAGRLGESRRAIEIFQKAREKDPGHMTALTALDQLLSEAEEHDARIEVLKAEAVGATLPREAATAWLEAARVAEECLGQDERAIALLEEGRKQIADDPSILSSLALRYEAAGAVEPLVEVLEAQVKLTRDRRALAEIQLRLGSLLVELERSEEAVAAYRQALDARPGDPVALSVLGKLYYRLERWKDLIWTFEQEMAGSRDATQRANRAFKIAELQEQRLGDSEAAIETLRRVLDEAPGYLSAVQALTRLYEASERWEDMISLLETEASETEDLDQKVGLLDRVARVQEERLKDLVAATETWERALSLRSGHLPALRSLARLYRKLERFEDLIRVLEQEAGQVEDQRQLIALLHQVAELHEERLEDRDGAIAAYCRVLALQPNYLPALKALGRLCEQAKSWQALVDMYRMEVEVTTSLDHLVSILMKIGEIYERRLNDEDAAISTYKEVLEEHPESLAALRALERIYTRRGDWEAVVESLRSQAEVFEGSIEKALILTRAGLILEQRIKNLEAACSIYEKALELEPDHRPALRAIARLRSAAGAWQQLADLYSRALDGGGQDGSHDIRRRLGLLYLARLDDPGAARECFEAVVKSEPGDLLSLAALDMLYTAAGEHEAAARTRIAMAEHAGSQDAATALLHSAALIQEHLIAGGAGAEELWQRLYELAPELPAAARMAELRARRAKDRRMLAKVSRKKLESASGDDVRLALLMRIGDLEAEDLHDFDAAEKAFREALELAPNHLPAIRGLKRTLASSQKWEEVQLLLEREGEVSRDPERSVALLFEAGVLREEHLKDLSGAERNYKKVLERNPREQRAYERLCALLEDQGRYKELAEVHAWQAGISQDSKIKADARMAAARIHAGPLSDPRAALSHVEKALESAPKSQEALELGADLALSLEMWEKAAVLAQQRIELGGEPSSLNPHRLRLAMLHHEHLGSPERAVAWLNDVLSVDPQNKEALRRLADIHVASGNWAAAVGTLGKLAEAEKRTEFRMPTLLELATIQVDHRNDIGAAISTLEYVRMLDPTNIEAVHRLGSFHESAGDWEALARTFGDFIEEAPESRLEETYPLLIRLAELQAGPLDSAAKAKKSYRAALDINPNEIEPRIALANLLAKEPSSRPLAIEEHQRVLEIDPFRLDSYHALFQLFSAEKQTEKAWVATAILHYFKACTEEETFFYSDHKERAAAEPTGALSKEVIDSLLRHEDAGGPLAEVLEVMGNQLSRVYPPNLEGFSVGKSNRLTPKDTSPLRKICDSLARSLGGLEFELYRSDEIPDALEAYAADPPILVAGPLLIRNHSVGQQRFLLSRLICRLVMSTNLCLQLEREELAAAIQAAVQVAVPGYKGLGAPDDLDLVKRCGKSMARRAKKALEEPASNLADYKEPIDLDRFRTGVIRTSERAALLLSADVETGLGIIAKEAGKTDARDIDALRDVSAIEEALRFFSSEAYYELRRQLNISL